MIGPWFFCQTMRRQKLYPTCMKKFLLQCKILFFESKSSFLIVRSYWVWWDKPHSCDLSILDVQKHHRNKSMRILLRIFVQLFTAHLLKKNQGSNVCLTWDTLKLLNVAKLLPHPVYIENNFSSQFFIISLEHIQVLLYYNSSRRIHSTSEEEVYKQNTTTKIWSSFLISQECLMNVH